MSPGGDESVDGGLRVIVDAYGAFGSQAWPADNAWFNPSGATPAAGTTYESGVFLRHAGSNGFLAQGDIGGSGNLPSRNFTSTTASTAVSDFTRGVLNITLTQTVQDRFNAAGTKVGSALVQDHEITNTGAAAVDFSLIRYIDGDLYFSGGFSNDWGGVNTLDGSMDQQLFEFDSGDDPNAPTTLVGIRALGGVVPANYFEIDSYSGLRARIIAGTPLDNSVAGDGSDANLVTDGSYDITLALQRDYQMSPNEVRHYTTVTEFGTGTTGEAPIQPVSEQLGRADAAPGTYSIHLIAADDDGGVSTLDLPVTISAENACAEYSGALFVCTSSTRVNTTTVMLAATLRDITAVQPLSDPEAGDIRHATVRFRVYDVATNALIAELPNVAVGLVNGDFKTGTATVNWTANIGSGDAKTYRVVVDAGGWYTSAATCDLITVARAADGAILGGGFLLNTASAGQLAGDPSLKTNFGFNAKALKAGVLQGSAVILVRRLESDGLVHTYQIRSTAILSLWRSPATGQATFNAKATIQDVTDPTNPSGIDGNASLQITLCDRGEPGTKDSIGITVWNKAGGIYFSSLWNGIRTVEDSLDGGNLTVR